MFVFLLVFESVLRTGCVLPLPLPPRSCPRPSCHTNSMTSVAVFNDATYFVSGSSDRT